MKGNLKAKWLEREEEWNEVLSVKGNVKPQDLENKFSNWEFFKFKISFCIPFVYMQSQVYINLIK